MTLTKGHDILNLCQVPDWLMQEDMCKICGASDVKHSNCEDVPNHYHVCIRLRDKAF